MLPGRAFRLIYYWLKKHLSHNETNLAIRLDEINLMVVADTSALLRHHVNKFG